MLLIIEDDPFVRRYYERVFRLHNYHVEMAESGIQGLKMAKKMMPALIFLDIMMPGMDGFQVLEELKKDPEMKKSVVVMLTNFGEESSIKKATSLGAAEYLLKSDVSVDDLLKTVDKYLK